MVHQRRRAAARVATELAQRLLAAGAQVRVISEGQDLPEAVAAGAQVVPADGQAAHDCTVVVGVGGDGTLLHGAEYARPAQVPLLGVNVGRVGFLAEAEPDQAESIVTAIVQGSYETQARSTIDVEVAHEGQVMERTWALNDATVEKGSRERILDLVLEVDGRPLAHWGGDGLVCATPTGSTAYAYSAGGPVVWPEVEAMLVVPISAHALFARPIVIPPTSQIVAHVVGPRGVDAVLWCDGRRTAGVPVGAQVRISKGHLPVMLARVNPGPFTDRLVEKFDLPVHGWRAIHGEDSDGEQG